MDYNQLCFVTLIGLLATTYFNATPLLLATNVNQMMHYLQFEPTINFFVVQILDKMI